MWLTSVLDHLKSTSLRTRAGRARPDVRRRKPAATRLMLEALEDRCLLSFSPAVSYLVGTGPLAVVKGDFNGDGRLDLAVANQSSNTVSVLLGNADGAFQLARDSATGASPNSLAVGDFNGDGKLDIVTDNFQNMTVSVLLGNGDGTFQAARNYSTDSNPGAVAVGDFNGDGKLDIVTDTANDTVNVLLGKGDGAFQAARSTAVMGGPPLAVAVGDFNADGKLDLAVTTSSVSRYFSPALRSAATRRGIDGANRVSGAAE